MTEESRGSIVPLPGGLSRSISGGTRNQIKLSRPWQPTLESIIDPAKCPFETKPQTPIKLPGIPDGWILLPNPWTPHPRHRLIIPGKCWPAEKLQSLGGKKEIVSALTTAKLAIQDDHCELAVFILVGSLSGQNLGHAHWHLLQVEVKQPLQNADLPPKCLISRHKNLGVFAAGARAGECLIVPAAKMNFNSEIIGELAQVIGQLVDLGNQKFCSQEGLPPHFSVTVRISANHSLRYINYCPILNNWGSPEYVIAPLEGGPYSLPWPHQVTASYLRQNLDLK